jgi:hypothetical protein
MPERWRDVVGYEGFYRVSDQGRVRSLHNSGRIRQLVRHRSGHLIVCLCRSGRRKTHRVHALVAEAFIGPRPQDMEVRHKDGDPSNNLLTNITYGTHGQNMQDRKWHRGSKAHKLTVEEVRYIKRRINGPRGTLKQLAEQFQVTPSNIWCIKEGRIHTDITA